MSLPSNSNALVESWSSFLYRYLRPHILYLFLSVISVIISSANIILLGVSIKYFVNTPIDNLWYTLSIFFTGFSSLMCLSIFGRIYFVNLGGQKIIAQMRKDVGLHIIQRSPEFFEYHRIGEIISIITADISVIENFISGGFTVMLRHTLTTLVSMCMVFYTNFELAIDILMIIPLGIIIKIVIGNKVKKLSRNCRNSVGSLGSCFEDVISNIKLIQSFCWEAEVIKKFSSQTNQCASNFIRYSFYRAIFIVVVIFSILAIIFLVLWQGLNHLSLNLVDTGSLFSFLFYVLIASGGLSGISDGLSELQQSASSLGRVRDLLQDYTGLNHKPAFAESLNKIKKVENIVFHNVCFSYPSRKEKLLLKNYCLEINAGETVALVGRSGVGKSTIFNLLMRFYEVNSGAITVNSKDIRDLDIFCLRKIFGWVPQENILISDTLRHNLSCGDNSITTKRIEEVLDMVEMLQFVRSLEKGLETQVCEKGSNFSGGQKQRLGIARALLQDPNVLLFDEATSSLDSQNEAIIQNTIFNTYSTKTKLIIAHRLSTIIKSDKIAVMENGKIVELGAHEKLLEYDGVYKKLISANIYK